MLKSISAICADTHLKEEPCNACPISERVLSGHTSISFASAMDRNTKCLLDESFPYCPYVGQKLPVWRKLDGMYMEVDE